MSEFIFLLLFFCTPCSNPLSYKLPYLFSLNGPLLRHKNINGIKRFTFFYFLFFTNMLRIIYFLSHPLFTLFIFILLLVSEICYSDFESKTCAGVHSPNAWTKVWICTSVYIHCNYYAMLRRYTIFFSLSSFISFLHGVVKDWKVGETWNATFFFGLVEFFFLLFFLNEKSVLVAFKVVVFK